MKKLSELAKACLGHYGPSKKKTTQKTKNMFKCSLFTKDAESYGAMWDKQKKVGIFLKIHNTKII